MRHLGCVLGAVRRKCPRSEHRPALGLAGNEVALPARAVVHLECSAANRWGGERAADSNHLRLAGDLVEPPRHQPDLVNQMPGRGTGDRLGTIF